MSRGARAGLPLLFLAFLAATSSAANAAFGDPFKDSRLEPNSGFLDYFGDFLKTSRWLGKAAGVWNALGELERPGMRRGLWEIHPYYKFSETYDSNIYLVPDDKPDGATVGGGKTGSWIHENDFGLKAALPFARGNLLDLDYDADDRVFSKQPGANNALNQKAGIAYRYKGPVLRGGVSDSYTNTTDPAFSELVKRERRWQNTAGASAEYGREGGALFAGVDGFHQTDKYVSPAPGAALNRFEQQGGAKAGYWIAPRTRLYAAYHRDVIHYTAGRAANSKAHLLDFGLEGDIASKLKGRIQTGVQYRKYDADPANPGAAGVIRNWQMAAALAYQPIGRTTVILDLSRRLEEATFGASRFYVATAAALGAQHRLPYKLTAGLGFGAELDKYSETATLGGVTANRSDRSFLEHAGLRYDIQEWLYADAGYTHKHRHSRFADQFSYDDHATTLSLGLRF